MSKSTEMAIVPGTEPIKGSQIDKVVVVEEITQECVKKALVGFEDPQGAINLLWEAAMNHVPESELDEDISSVMSTIGFVSALFMSFTFGRSGHDFESHRNSLWGDGDLSDFMKDLFTLMCGLITLSSFAAAVASSRIYMDIKLVPKNLVKASVATMGKGAVIDMVFVSFFIITVSSVLAVILYLTLMLPLGMGIIALVVCVIVAATTIRALVKVDQACGKVVRQMLVRSK